MLGLKQWLGGKETKMAALARKKPKKGPVKCRTIKNGVRVGRWLELLI